MKQIKKNVRNIPCPCGSGLKYKKCCLIKKNGWVNAAALYQQKYNIRLKNQQDIEGIRRTGRLVVDTLDMIEKKIKAGVTTDELNTWVHEFTVKNSAIPAPLNYKGFPKSCCVSINEVICHGIPSQRLIKDGDIVNVDVTTILNNYYADANKTFLAGAVGSGGVKIVNVAYQCLRRGIAAVKPGNTLGDIGWAIQSYAEGEGCSVVRDFVGHGVGLDFHEAPEVPHYGKPSAGIPLTAGMVFTIEPMINLGVKELTILDDNWTAVTRDRKLSAQFEQTLVVTETGVESLTPY